MKQWSITSGPAGTLLVVGNPDNPVQTLIQNVDPVNILYVGETSSVNPFNPLQGVPMLPGQSMVATGEINVFGIAAAGQNVAVNTLRGVGSYFQPTNLGNIGGVSIFVQATAPTGTIALNSLWFAPNGIMYVWNGTAWVQQRFAGNQILTASSIYAAQLAAGIIYAGIVDGTTIQAATFIGGYALYYSSPNPALGTLIASAGVVTGFTDSVGNHVYGGNCTYQPVAGSATAQLTTQLRDGTFNVWSPSGIGPGSPASVSGTAGQAGLINILSGGTISTDNQAELVLLSQNASGGNYPESNLTGLLGLLPLPSTTLPNTSNPAVWANAAGTPYGKAVMSGALGLGLSDYTTFVNNTTSMNQMSRVWPIPLGDYYNNVTYRFNAWGHGTEGTSTQQLNTQMSALALTFAGNNMPGADIPNNAAFHWWYQLVMVVTNSSIVYGGQFTWSQAAVTANRGTAAIDGSISGLPSGNTNITLQLGWGSISGGPSITSTGSTLERVAG
jgi:hypothetical protein